MTSAGGSSSCRSAGRLPGSAQDGPAQERGRRSAGSPASFELPPRRSSLVARSADARSADEEGCRNAVGPAADEWSLGFGQSLHHGGAGRLRGGLRTQWPAERASEERRNVAPIELALVQPRVAAIRNQEQLHVGSIASSSGYGRIPEALRMPGWDHPVQLAVDEEDRSTIAGDRGAGTDVAHAVASRPQELAGRQPAERPGDRAREGEPGQPERLA